ncbi:uncharacterized protein DSM5745_09417 [Aspergillus mulundensis]|uniref:Uncharacterized protein n=1 Tax=Aspergillus mulundensis TaxID=1810919 RepID=A0A3D8QVE9_9EURO|nr:hypothetical protein DSM5745_09417 [Aspergillus mulundensis]RDW65678.1 hypothetical protein DSM5745_09417 [Aspergillus mulundensis]
MTKPTTPSTSPTTTSPTSNNPATLNEYAFDDTLDDPFFSKTSFPSAGIASADPASEETTRNSRWLAALTESPEVYAAADQLVVERRTSSLPCSPSSLTSQQQVSVTPTSNNSSDSSDDTSSPSFKDKGELPARLRPELSIIIPDWADGTPMPRTLSTYDNNNTRSSSAALRRQRELGYLYSTAQEDILREVRTARRENEALKSDILENQRKLEIAKKKIDMLAAMVLRERGGL